MTRYSPSDATLDAARAALSRARTGTPAPGLGDAMARGAAIGAVASLPIPFVGLLGGALVGAGVAAYDRLSRG